MAVRRIVVLAGKDVEPGFAKMGETILAQTPANKPLDDRLLDIGAGRIAHMDEIGIDVQSSRSPRRASRCSRARWRRDWRPSPTTRLRTP